MKRLTAKMTTALSDLYAHAQSQNGLYDTYQVNDVHHAVLKGLQRRGLIALDACPTESGRIQWGAALTAAGAQYIDDNRPGIDDSGLNARQRITVQIQLDMNNRQHAAALRTIESLKRGRSFTETLVMAITQLLPLHEELIQGLTTILESRYQFAVLTLTGRNESPEVEQFRGMFEDIMQELKRRPAGGSEPQSLQGAPKPLGGGSLPPPQWDDEDDDLLEVKESDGSNSNATANFLASVERLMKL
jgi:hypothetical protein